MYLHLVVHWLRWRWDIAFFLQYYKSEKKIPLRFFFFLLQSCHAKAFHNNFRTSARKVRRTYKNYDVCAKGKNLYLNVCRKLEGENRYRVGKGNLNILCSHFTLSYGDGFMLREKRELSQWHNRELFPFWL
jgi:hypothetical protein